MSIGGTPSLFIFDFWVGPEKNFSQTMLATKLLVDSSIFCAWGLLSFVDVVIVYLCEPFFKLGGKVLRLHSRKIERTPRVVILGSSFAGLSVRSALGPSFEVVLVDRKVSLRFFVVGSSSTPMHCTD